MTNPFGHFIIHATCIHTFARTSTLTLRTPAHLPTFMPVATKATLKGILTSNISTAQILLANTFHCRHLYNLSNFMKYNKPMLTDSGGFQIVSLEGTEVTEDGVIFYDSADKNVRKKIKMRPEDSVKIQKRLGADIIMQLDDVVNPLESREKVQCAMERSLRWLERCYAAFHEEKKIFDHLDADIYGSSSDEMNDDINLMTNKTVNAADTRTKEIKVKINKNIVENANKVKVTGEDLTDISACLQPENIDNDAASNRHISGKQLLFPIIQGGLHKDLRKRSLTEILKFNPKGIAIGGLSGGESKQDFISTVKYTIQQLPPNIPRYVMGIGYPEDLVACVAVGADMADCVYPTRTARFGTALCDDGDINLKKSKFLCDMQPIESDCCCFTCLKHTRAFIHSLKGTSNFCILLTIHNLEYMKRLMDRISASIVDGNFDVFVKEWAKRRFKHSIPDWFRNVFDEFGINL